MSDVPALIGHCHGGVGCRQPGNVAVTYQTQPIVGSRSAPGLIVTVGACPGHRNGLPIPDGATILSVHEIPLPAPAQPEPVGLDAVDPPLAAEPVKIKVPRRRRKAQP